MANSRTSEDQAGRRSDWFAGRRNHCIRQVLDESLQLVQWFRQMQQRAQDRAKSDAISMDPETLAEWLRQWTIVLGTENNKGALWQLKDRCCQLWPREDRSQPASGVRLDWLIGSLFHEAVKLKENLCLLNNYCATTMDCAPALAGGVGPSSVGQVQEYGVFIDDVVGYVAEQTGRVGICLIRRVALFGLCCRSCLAIPWSFACWLNGRVFWRNSGGRRCNRFSARLLWPPPLVSAWPVKVTCAVKGFVRRWQCMRERWAAIRSATKQESVPRISDSFCGNMERRFEGVRQVIPNFT